MPPITWRNIGAPSFGDAVMGMSAAGKRMDSAHETFQQVTNALKKTQEDNWDNQARINTEDVIASMQGHNNIADLNQSDENYGAQALRKAYGAQVNMDDVNSALGKKRSDLQDVAAIAAQKAGQSILDQGGSMTDAMAAHSQSLQEQGMEDVSRMNSFNNTYNTDGLAGARQAQSDQDRSRRIAREDKLIADERLLNNLLTVGNNSAYQSGDINAAIREIDANAGGNAVVAAQAKNQLLSTLSPMSELNERDKLMIADVQQQSSTGLNLKYAKSDAKVGVLKQAVTDATYYDTGHQDLAKQIASAGGVVDYLTSNFKDVGLIQNNIGKVSFDNNAKEHIRTFEDDLIKAGLTNAEERGLVVAVTLGRMGKSVENWAGDNGLDQDLLRKIGADVALEHVKYKRASKEHEVISSYIGQEKMKDQAKHNSAMADYAIAVRQGKLTGKKADPQMVYGQYTKAGEVPLDNLDELLKPELSELEALEHNILNLGKSKSRPNRIHTLTQEERMREAARAAQNKG